MGITKEQANTVIGKLRNTEAEAYEKYFDSIRPTSDEGVFRRWLFAYASVHTTWKYNCILYEKLEPLDWLEDDKLLRQRIVESRAGLYNERTRYISSFSKAFWDDPSAFGREENEDWFAYRDRMRKQSLGLGNAKAAFAIELTCFHDAKLACFDVHMLRLYGIAPTQRNHTPRITDVREAEQHWVKTCGEAGFNPVTARWLYWDQFVQGKPDSRYWSHVLEN